jgi:hypothetical protein
VAKSIKHNGILGWMIHRKILRDDHQANVILLMVVIMCVVISMCIASKYFFRTKSASSMLKNRPQKTYTK